ncbi:hypothetical protein E2C01_063693 [Portunus trituberculatus]|uniref:Uncharacterized protein n=1 Tax=Portunus trituberculatus TaxID=210409 RepID=A0A5B7HJQ1_PORTR|nr:hypothetical protein [Portunus trituberculatus]
MTSPEPSKVELLAKGSANNTTTTTPDDHCTTTTTTTTDDPCRLPSLLCFLLSLNHTIKL